ncbi:hypothetical protein, partial [Candidatus Villigracilis affinis]|uniref:hypothetical protein n=1 Tax=Candidatus Villigracilis affinis TaxID=3140682 RepID=UPI0031EB2DAB
ILFFLNAALWLGYVIYIYYDMAIVNKNLTSSRYCVAFCLRQCGVDVCRRVAACKKEDES